MRTWYKTLTARAIVGMITLITGGATNAAPICYQTRFVFPSAGLVKDQSTRLTWTQAVGAGSWGSALAYCSGLGAGWRLPTAKELLSIVDDSRTSPAINMTAFPNCPSEKFWTNTVSSGDTSKYWTINFTDGSSEVLATSSSARVRCITDR